MSDSIVIVSAARTPIGGLLGDFSSLAAHQLGAVAIQAAVARAGVPGDAVNEVLMGNCLMAGQGQAPARQATLGAGLPQSAGAVTLSKMCGSGMRAMMFGHDMLKAESADVVVAGGMESMTNAPHLMFARKGVRYGAAQMFDHMAIDGLEDAYDKGRAMGVFAEECVAKYNFTREAQDAFAIASTQRSKKANEDGSFDWEMAPVTLPGKSGDTVVKFDEQPFKAKLDKIPGLKPAFKKDGTITAANASSISDGAAALVLMKKSEADKRGLKILGDTHVPLRGIRCVPATVLPGGFDRLETRGLHLAAGDQPFSFLCIYLRPDAPRSAWGELLKPVLVVEAFLLPVDPAVAQGDIQGFLIGKGWNPRILLGELHPNAGGFGVLPGKPVRPFLLVRKR